jgi:putative ABC transport system permease protein
MVAPAAKSVQTRLHSIAGVGVVEGATIARVSVAANAHAYPTTLTGLQPATVMHGFRAPDGTECTLPPDGVLAGAALAGKIGVRIGDEITVVPGTGPPRRVRLVGLLDEPLGTALYATDRTARSITGEEPNAYLLRFGAHADRDQVRTAATGLTGVVAYTDTHAVENQLDRFLVIFWAFAGAMLILGALLAFTVIYVTMTVNLAERTAELAVLRAAGVPVRRITAVLATENIVATLLAVPVGLAAGMAAGWLFLRSFNNDLFSLHLSVGPVVSILAVLAVTAAAALSQLPAARLIKHIDVVGVVRERGQ